MNTKITYYYSDAMNSRTEEVSFVIEGVMEPEIINQVQAEISKYGSKAMFVPSDAGLPCLQEKLTSEFGASLDHDHPYHNITAIELTKEEPTFFETWYSFDEMACQPVLKYDSHTCNTEDLMIAFDLVETF